MSEYTILGFSEITIQNLEEFTLEVKKRGSQEISQLSERDLSQIINTFNVFNKSYDDADLWDVLKQAILLKYEEYNKENTEHLRLDILCLLAKGFSSTKTPDLEMQYFIEKNIQRIKTLRAADSKNFIECCHALVCRNYKASEKCKFFMIRFLVKALSNLKDGDKFVEAMQFIGTIEYRHIQLHFRKINGICISIFTENFFKFSPASLLVTLDNMKKLGIRHSAIHKCLMNYTKKVEGIIGQLSLVEQISFIQILNYCNKPELEYLYTETFYSISKNVKSETAFAENSSTHQMNIQELKFLLKSLLGCVKIADKSATIKAVITDQLNNQEVLPRLLKILKKFPADFLQNEELPVPTITDSSKLSNYIYAHLHLGAKDLDQEITEDISNKLQTVPDEELPQI